MKKAVAASLFLLALLFSLPIITMNLLPDKYKLVSFKTDNGTVDIEKQNIPLIGGLSEKYDDYLKSKNKAQHNIPLLPNSATTEEILCINKALNARPDTFAVYFKGLSEDEKNTLLRVSMSFKQNGATVGLDVPIITARLIRVFFPEDIAKKIELLSEAVKKKEAIFNFCLSQCIKKQSFFNSGMKQDFPDKNLASTLSWESSFFSGPFSHNESLSAKPLPIEKSLYKTYGSVFLSDRYEIRIIDGIELQSRDFIQQPLGNACCLHIIDHETQKSIAYQDILHANNIKGYCSTKVDNNTHYFVTYSDKDIVFSTITKTNDEDFIIDQAQIKTPGEMATACFEKSILNIITYENHRSMLYNLDSNNHWQLQLWFHFKEWGVIDQIFAVNSGLIILHPVAGKAKASLVYSDGGNVMFGRLYSVNSSEDNWPQTMYFMHKGKGYPNRRLLAWNIVDSVFKSLQSYRERQEQSGAWQKFKNYFSFEPDNECCRVYSPDGRFMMTNRLITKMKKPYIKTSITNVMNQQEIISHDTICDAWGNGIGFSSDSRDILFFHSSKHTWKIPLITDEFERCMAQFEKCAFRDLGTIDLISRLIPEILEKDYIALRKSDSTREMLLAWANNNEGVALKDFMQTCFPFAVTI